MDHAIQVLTFEGSQTIERAEIVKDSLMNAVKGKKKEILINLSGLEKTDLSFLQLLYSASLEAGKNKKKFTIKSDVPPMFLEMLQLSGFNRINGGASDDLFADLNNVEE